ncbi:MAG: bifunctional folylpolyglutamate synthase/dihydrofolate synthase [Candidatus Diapherotrites archaeon]|uniref:Probable bifunctional folylpolyglutamate synthase/dihydropteroate synthase n=1 Tax=Candidatus Iainarchaeum sp. TaxID=3101447 RepID=A0A8T3YKS9_9ARCH|nr:bifunctional folylpolyglutamate synthase/dihydrofolate synthase [Candidatus Diapherotrites archaeon]
MNYGQSKAWLDSLGQRMTGFDLGNITRLVRLSRLGMGKLKCVHVAGTNGKGSTCAFIAGILQESGFRTGLYTSPHILEPAERIKINGHDIPREKFSLLASHFREIIEAHSIDASYFEAITAMAFRHFLEENADFAVIETGMGGRLDATNIVEPLVSVITSISLEHTQYLGRTIGKIAAEKAGIIKRGTPVVVARNNSGIKTIMRKAAKMRSAVSCVEWNGRKDSVHGEKLDLTAPEKIAGLETSLAGNHQCENAALAAAAALALAEKGVKITRRSIREGLRKAKWKGRLQILRKRPLVVLDAAHNPDGWEKLRKALGLFRYKKLTVVFGAMKDKDVKGAKELLTLADELILTKAGTGRAEEPENIMRKAGNGIVIVPARAAIREAVNAAGKEDMVLVTGSIYLLAEAYMELGR